MPDRDAVERPPARETLEQSAIPFYAQLSRIIRTQINSGEFKPGDTLPTEEGLCQTYGVSRITVREALRILVNEGLIVRQSGRGTFVANRFALGTSIWTAGTIEDIIQGGHRADRRYLGRQARLANRGVAGALRLPTRSRVVEVQSLVEVGGVPLAHLTLTVPWALGRILTPEKLSNRPVILLLADEFGLQVSEVDQWTTASLADKRVGDLLRIRVGDPILIVERIFYDTDGRPIELAVNRYRTDRFRLHMCLKQAAATRDRRAVLPVAR